MNTSMDTSFCEYNTISAEELAQKITSKNATHFEAVEGWFPNETISKVEEMIGKPVKVWHVWRYPSGLEKAEYRVYQPGETVDKY